MMLNKNMIQTMLLRFMPLALLTLPASLYSFKLPPLDDAPKKTAVESPFKKPARQRRTAQTRQEREEQSMQQTLDELAAIAEGLSKFALAKEIEETSKTKAKKQEAKEKEAAQRLKQQQSRGRPWTPSGSYTPSRSSYGGGGYGGYGGGYGGSGRSYGGGYGGGGSPWSRSSSPWASSGSGYSRPGYRTPDFDKDDDETDTKTKKESKKDKDGTVAKGGGAAPEPRKDTESHYVKLVNNTKQAADLIETTLDGIKGKTGTAAAVALLNNKQFGRLNTKLISLLSDANKSRIELQDEEFKNFESKKKNAHKKEQDRLTGAMNKLIPHALLAATLNQEGDQTSSDYNPITAKDEQASALSLLKNIELDYLKDKEGLFEARGKTLLNYWHTKNDDAIKTERAKIKKGEADKKFFIAKQAEIGAITEKLPKLSGNLPALFNNEIKEFDADLKNIAAVLYTKLVNATKQAADLITTALDSVRDKTGTDAAVALLNLKQFSKLNSKFITPLSDANKSSIELQDNELKEFENKNNNAYKKEQDRLIGVMNKLIPHALLAATLDKDGDKASSAFNPTTSKDEQTSALSLLKNSELKHYLKDKEELFQKRGKMLLNYWHTKNDAAISAQRAEIKPGADKDELKKFFIAKQKEIRAISEQLPLHPDELTTLFNDEIKQFDEDLKKIDEL